MCRCVFCGERTRGTTRLPGGDPGLCPDCLRQQRLEICEDLVLSGMVLWADMLLDLEGGDGANAPDLAPY
jgi:hypothetical protein